MTSKEKRIILYHKLIGDLRADVHALRAITLEIEQLGKDIDHPQTSVPVRDLMSCAAYLHHFYTGVESMFERICKVFDGGITGGGDYHRELLRTMAGDIPTIRPAIIDSDLMELLDEYRRFRHMFRHAYGTELRWRNMQPLVNDIANVMKRIDEAVQHTIEFTTELIRSLS